MSEVIDLKGIPENAVFVIDWFNTVELRIEGMTVLPPPHSVPVAIVATSKVQKLCRNAS